MITSSRTNLLEHLPFLKTILKSRAFQPVFMLITLTLVNYIALIRGDEKSYIWKILTERFYTS